MIANLAVMCALTVAAHAIGAPPTFHLTRAGVATGAATGMGGVQHSQVVSLSPAGALCGFSALFPPNSAIDEGAAAWVALNGTTTQLGFAGPAYEQPSGLTYSVPVGVNDAGWVVGTSDRFNQATFTDHVVAWLWSGTSLRRIGFADAAHTGPDGTQSSLPYAVNAAGAAIGESYRWQSGAAGASSRDAWIDEAGQLTRLGFTDDEHTDVSLTQVSFPLSITGSGFVVGHSQRFLGGSVYRGSTAWLWHGGVTTRLGFVDGDYTSSAGDRLTSAIAVNEAGDVIGGSTRYLPGPRFLITAWLFRNGQAAALGLTDAEHTAPLGGSSSTPRQLNRRGDVTGSSVQFNGESFANGESAWLHQAGQTVRLGLIDAEHTQPATGRRHSTAQFLNDRGVVAGSSARFVGTSGAADISAWVYSTGQTIRLGLTGPAFTRATGQQSSAARALGNSGHVAGTSDRYDSSAALERVAWLFDPATGVTHEITPPRGRPTPGKSLEVEPLRVSDNGAVVGRITSSDPEGTPESSLFWWSASDGFHELASLVEGGIVASGFSRLRNLTQQQPAQADFSILVAEGVPVGAPNDSLAVGVLTSSNCAADVNADGTLNPDDLSDFVTCFFLDVMTPGSCATADFNGDEARNPDDLSDFITAFFIGCG